MALPALPIIAGAGGLLGGLFGGGDGMSKEQKRLIEQAMRMQEEQYGMTAPLRELGVEQLQQPLTPRPDISAGFFDPGNAYNRIPMPATLAGGPAGGMPGAQNPVLAAVGEQLGALGIGPDAAAPPPIPPPSDAGGMGVPNAPILPATQQGLPRPSRPQFLLPARR